MTNLISRLFGAFASMAFPSIIQSFINRVYVALFHIDLSEFEESKNFTTLNKLFTRRLKQPRIFDTTLNVLISPTDSLITESATTSKHKALQIKGMEYDINELLGEKIPQDMEFSYINLYLSPRDYHRYHAPCDMYIEEIRYFGGELLPVHIPALKKFNNLFIRNERVVLKAKMYNGKTIYFVAVGALNVGSIVFHCEPKIHTNAKKGNETYTYASPIAIQKGEELGMFNMGSTIVLFIEDFTPQIQSGDKVRYAQNLGTLA
ncbi:phosphatidylserine decarboxylase [uncultured Helicobacter sp.]|uniref:phosphatidylserine decarboxylase n=1 Tax=uncultured Helicobacter sp. TaxID=175537 RepID=UPI0037511554